MHNHYSTRRIAVSEPSDPQHQRMEDPEIPMTLAQYETLLQGLKACELNYKSQLKRLGTTSAGEVKLWA